MFGSSFSQKDLLEKSLVQKNKKNADALSGGRNLRIIAVFLILLFSLFGIIILNINLGSVTVSASEIWEIIVHKEGAEIFLDIIWKIRLPRICMAVILGGALALSGLLLQIFFNNPIAGPFVLGISSGAKLIVAVCMIFFVGRGLAASSFALIAAAFCGSMAVTGFVLLIARKVRLMPVLLVGGVMVGYICSAATDFIITFAEDSDIVNLQGWSLGSFSGMSWENVRAALIVVISAGLVTFFLSKPIGAYQMGESYAQSLGVDIKRFRVLLIVLSGVLSACVAAFAGPVSFVGIAVPHLIRRALGSSAPIIAIPATFLGGAVFCTFCDLIARTAFSPTELSISAVTSVLGAPVVIAMLLKRSKRL